MALPGNRDCAILPTMPDNHQCNSLLVKQGLLTHPHQDNPHQCTAGQTGTKHSSTTPGQPTNGTAGQTGIAEPILTPSQQTPRRLAAVQPPTTSLRASSSVSNLWINRTEQPAPSTNPPPDRLP